MTDSTIATASVIPPVNLSTIQTRQTVENTVVTVNSIFAGTKNVNQVICRLAKKKLLANNH